MRTISAARGDAGTSARRPAKMATRDGKRNFATRIVRSRRLPLIPADCRRRLAQDDIWRFVNKGLRVEERLHRPLARQRPGPKPRNLHGPVDKISNIMEAIPI